MRAGFIAQRAVALALVLTATACAAAPPSEAPAVSVASLGEPTDGFPSWGERVVFVWTNRARADPAADLASCGATCAERACYSPVPPVVWSHNLSRAARFHSANLVLGGCGLQHNSPCTLLSTIGALYTPGACDGAPSCACMGGSATCGSMGTAFGPRVGYFGTPASAENIARGRTDPVATFYQWLHEADSNAACGWRTANGHRANILGTSRALGVGLWSSTWTQDFGSSGTPAGIVGGVHYPRTGAALDFRANWYAAAAPRSAQVSVEGTCSTMAVERGSSTNGTYLANLTGIPGTCTRYVFHFVDSAGADVFYPSTGSFTIGCAAEWDATRPATCGACAPSCGTRACGDDGCGGSCGMCGAGRTCNASGACACAAGTTDCGGTCVDTTTDEAHCGGCSRPCGAGSTCTASACSCVPSCAGRACGSDGCTGTCGSCPMGRVCSAGACACTGGTTDCSGACVDVRTDEAHCGACGAPCPATESCMAGVCTMSTTCMPDCAGRGCGSDGCTGSCGTCGAFEVCGAGGVCGCDATHTDCGAGCVDVTSDPMHCGACGAACATGRACVGGVCEPGSATDAGPSATDAGASASDAGAGTSDTGPSVSDAGPRADTGPSGFDGGEGPATGALVGTCACRAARPRASLGPALSILALALALVHRRSRRPA